MAIIARVRVSSKPFNYQLDWLVPDRVIDVPAYQDVLTWGEHGQASKGGHYSVFLCPKDKHHPFVMYACNVRRMWIAC
jgi:hypothetical protein